MCRTPSAIVRFGREADDGMVRPWKSAEAMIPPSFRHYPLPVTHLRASEAFPPPSAPVFLRQDQLKSRKPNLLVERSPADRSEAPRRVRLRGVPLHDVPGRIAGLHGPGLPPVGQRENQGTVSARRPQPPDAFRARLTTTSKGDSCGPRTALQRD